MLSKTFFIVPISIFLYGCSPKATDVQTLPKTEVQSDELAVFKVFIDNEGKIEGDGIREQVENIKLERIRQTSSVVLR